MIYEHFHGGDLMTNNDVLIRLRYALNLKNAQMAEIFTLGDYNVSTKEVSHILTKSPEEDPEHIECTNDMLDAFLNGFIVYKRGVQEPRPGQQARPPLSITSADHVNNIILKKLRIALSLRSDDILNILDDAGTYLSNSELSAVLRHEDHRNYKICGDRYVRNFLKGLAINYRD